jgi:hypothetical protein
MRSAIAGLLVLSWVVTASAESLSDAARRESERRARNREAGVETKVIGGDELSAATPGRGTFNPGAPSPIYGEPAAGKGAAGKSEVEARRVAAHRRLESQYKKMAPMARRIVDDARGYDECVRAGRKASKCSSLFEKVIRTATTLAPLVDEAENDAREGWLLPGDQRAARDRQRVSEPVWDEATRLARRYRR